MLLEGLDIH